MTGRGDHLGVGVFQGRPGRLAVVLENGHLLDARVRGSEFEAVEVGLDDEFDLTVLEEGRRLAVVRRLHDHFVDADARHGAANPHDRAPPLAFVNEGGELVGRHPDLPALPVGNHIGFRGCHLFIAGAEGAFGVEGREFLPIRLALGELVRALGALRGDDDPFTGKEIVAKLGHVNLPQLRISPTDVREPAKFWVPKRERILYHSGLQWYPHCVAQQRERPRQPRPG